MMKIVYITKSLAPIGGLERVLTDKMNYLVQKGYDIVLITYEQGKHPFAYPLDHRVRHYDLDVVFFSLYKYCAPKRIFYQQYYRLLFRRRLQKLIRKLQPDIVITTTYSMVVADVIANLKTDARKIIESHVAYYVMRKQNEYINNWMMHLLAQFYDKRNSRAIRKYDAMVTLTKGDAEDWSKHTRKIVVIPNPITNYPEKVCRSQNSYHRIVCAGRLNSQKGFDLLIKAFARIADQCPQWRVDIFGSGEEKDILIQMLKDYRLSDRIFLNPPTADIYREYATSDFFVLSSRFEGFGLVLAEAMSCGIPCVSFNCKYGPGEIITDHVDGLLAEADNVNDLANKMLWMMEHEEERLAMGRAARQSAARYQQDVVMQQWIKLINKLLAGAFNIFFILCFFYAK